MEGNISEIINEGAWKELDLARMNEKIILQGELIALCSFAATCRMKNTTEWMEQLATRINRALDAARDGEAGTKQ